MPAREGRRLGCIWPREREMAERADQRTPSREGVVPIIRNGVLEGVNGGTTQPDEDCARAGVARL
jgi:hypothetical protein